MKENRILNILIIIFASIGITIQYMQQATDFYRMNFFTYYTTQTNIIILIICIYSLIPIRKGKFYNYLQTGSTIYILITGIIFHLLLNNPLQPTGINGFANHCVHTFVPILSVLRWISDTQKMKIKNVAPFLFLIYPFIFLIATLIRGHFSGYYPYWFLNPSRQGVASYLGVAKVCSIILLAFILIGYLFLYVNNRMIRQKNIQLNDF